MMKDRPPLTRFLGKLVDMSKNVNADIAGWSADGTQFLIKDTNRFNEEVLKQYFNGQPNTFTRQLHFYGFRKTESEEGQGGWGFSHEKFRRDNPDLVYEIRRKTKRGGMDKDGEAVYKPEILAREFKDLKRRLRAAENQIQKLEELVAPLRGSQLDEPPLPSAAKPNPLGVPNPPKKARAV